MHQTAQDVATLLAAGQRTAEGHLGNQELAEDHRQKLASQARQAALAEARSVAEGGLREALLRKRASALRLVEAKRK